MGRNPCCSKELGLSRGAWTAMEDKILTEYIKIHGQGKWRDLPKKAGLKRCGKSCRLRWLNYLRPGIKRGNITNDEEDLIIRLHNLLGNRWSLIAGRLPGRTDNEIKNYWNTNIGRKLQNGISNFSIKSGAPCSLSSVQQEHYPFPPNKGSSVVQTKATRVTVTKEIVQQNESIEINDNDINDDKMKKLLPSFEESNIDPLDFIADFEIDGDFFSELLKMDFPESSYNLDNKIMEDKGNLSTVDKGQSSSKSSNDCTHFPWGDSLFDTDFDLQPMAAFMESGFDWL